MQQEVLRAIRKLPEGQRAATTLFYINGYSQSDIAEFLDVPLTTVKKRLHDARNRLKERMIGMVEQALRDDVPDERFSQKVIAALLTEPKLLEIDGHPIRQVWDMVRSALPDFEVVTGDEVVDKEVLPAGQNSMDQAVNRRAYHVSEEKVLRPAMTNTAFEAIQGRTPPVRLLAPGRVFSATVTPLGIQQAHGTKIFHLLDGVCVEQGIDLDGVKAICAQVLRALFDTEDIHWQEAALGYECVSASAVAEINLVDVRHPVATCAILTPQVLREAGYIPDSVTGGAFNFVLDLLAMLKFGIDDIRQLWQAPCVP
jgi:phenylalanyl-tRNA synthetase alpha subunit